VHTKKRFKGKGDKKGVNMTRRGDGLDKTVKKEKKKVSKPAQT